MTQTQGESRDTSTNDLGGKWGPWWGGAMLAHLAFQLAYKLSQGHPEQSLWLSTAVLLVAGLGLLLRHAMLIQTALNAGLFMHLLWVIDFVIWLSTGSSPLSMVAYLDGATVVAWLSTSYHFYATPVLLVIALRDRIYAPAAGPASLGVLIAVWLAARFLATAEDNVNLAYHLSFLTSWRLIATINNFPPVLYVTTIIAFVFFAMVLPVHVAMGWWAKRSRRAMNRSGEPST